MSIKSIGLALELELELELEPKQVASAAATKKSVFHAETRCGMDRRQRTDRRQTIRFSTDRRNSHDRREGSCWDRQHSV